MTPPPVAPVAERTPLAPPIGQHSGTPAGPGMGATRDATRERLLALDVFRGLTVAGMLLVNDPGSWSYIFPPLEHAPWHGWTPTDLIFPFFLFIVGITTELSLGARRARGASDRDLALAILRRGGLIFLLGFLLNWFPFWQWGTIQSLPDAGFWDRVLWRIDHVRVFGVLQRIGLAYIIGGLLTLRTTLKQQVVILAVLLYGYWFAMALLPVPDTGALGALMLDSKGGTLAAWLDRAVLGAKHIWSGGVVYDPEGILSTIPAAGTVILGVLAGRWIGSPRPLAERLNGLFAGGALAAVAGMMWHWSFPINKSLWTSSYVVFTAGVACLTLGTIMWLVDVHRVTGWTKPFVVYGMNPLIAFLGSGLMARMIYSIWKVQVDGRPVAAQAAFHQAVFASWLPPRLASLCFALTFVLFWYAVLALLHRKRIYLKV
ncbi:MAG TPA: heparan-alpha-glucosaminide N-acetyltransferase domain-containing protein [Gemmatimonadaceae bacterium]|nr:heparan-alpha-glucosaminide N-acetyltransferase domain-containing protein [Gemmatimonadaceae bacterium]